MTPTDYSKSKYSDAIAEAADAIISDGMADETAGTVEYGAEHYALVTLDSDAALAAYENGSQAPLLVGSRVIIRTDAQGFVDTFYGPAHPAGDPAAYAALMAAWDDITAEDADEDDEDVPHTGHWSTFGTYWCDTCNSPYCERA